MKTLLWLVVLTLAGVGLTVAGVAWCFTVSPWLGWPAAVLATGAWLWLAVTALALRKALAG